MLEERGLIMKKLMYIWLFVITFLLYGCDSVKEEPLPDKFSLVEEERIPDAYSQGQTGMCWAFSTMTAAETNIITKGYAKRDDINLSESHLCYYAYPFVEDREASSKEDGIYLLAGKKGGETLPYCIGGMEPYAVGLLANGAGPIREELAPFYTNDGQDALNAFNRIRESEANGSVSKYMGDYLLKDACFYQTATVDEMKQAVYEKGAMIISYYSDMKYYNNSKEGSAYFEDKVKQEDSVAQSNHAVVIIGWDDNFSKENFEKCKPQKDGAWLAQNSASLPYAKGSYFWISYEEPSINSSCTLEMCKRTDYGAILNYDGCGYNEYIKSKEESTKIANVFSTDTDCELKAAGIYTLAKNQPIEIEIYKNSDINIPDSGESVSKTKMTLEWPGYHMIDLKSSIPVGQGEVFSILVTYECGSDEEMGRAPVEGISFKEAFGELYITSSEGESFACSNGNWYDLSKKETANLFDKENSMNNACIKAILQ